MKIEIEIKETSSGFSVDLLPDQDVLKVADQEFLVSEIKHALDGYLESVIDPTDV